MTTLDEYGLRFDIKENFLDDKSNGFQVEARKLDDASAMNRLFLTLAVTTLHCTSVGVGVVKAKLRRWADTHWDRDMNELLENRLEVATPTISSELANVFAFCD